MANGQLGTRQMTPKSDTVIQVGDAYAPQLFHRLSLNLFDFDGYIDPGVEAAAKKVSTQC